MLTDFEKQNDFVNEGDPPPSLLCSKPTDGILSFTFYLKAASN